MNKSADKTRQEFDEVARRFDALEFIPSHSAEYIPMKARLADYLPARGGLAIDVGCGVGTSCSKLAERFERVIAIDLSPEMVRVAQRYTSAYKNIEFVAADINAWSFPTPKADCIVSIGTLHHMPLEPILVKIKEGLASGGLLLIGDFYDPVGFEKIKRVIIRELKQLRNKWMKPSQNARPSYENLIQHDPYEPFPRMDEVNRTVLGLMPEARIIQHKYSYSVIWVKP